VHLLQPLASDRQVTLTRRPRLLDEGVRKVSTFANCAQSGLATGALAAAQSRLTKLWVASCMQAGDDDDAVAVEPVEETVGKALD
jgi:hypothetical protein